MSLLDKHIEISTYTEGMEAKEIGAYNLGVMSAIQNLLSEFQLSKENISNELLRLLETDELTAESRTMLRARLHILDVYSTSYAKHLDKLTKEFLV